MRTKEGQIKIMIKDILDALNVWHFSPSASAYGRSAIPDIICCVQGHFLAIEAKRGDLQPTAIQARELNRIMKSGGKAICVNGENIDKFELYMKKIMGVEDENP